MHAAVFFYFVCLAYAIDTVILNFTNQIGQVDNHFYGAQSFFKVNRTTNTAVQLNQFYDISIPGLKSTRRDAILQLCYGAPTNGSSIVRLTNNAYYGVPFVATNAKYGIMSIIIIDYMPSWLANTTMKGCSVSGLSDPNIYFCMPSNLTLFTQLAVDYVTQVSANGTLLQWIEFEIWNEPGAQFFLVITFDQTFRFNQYVILYTACYNAIKLAYPNAIVAPQLVLYNNQYVINFLSLGLPMDFYSAHPYPANPQNSDMAALVNKILRNCLTTNNTNNCNQIRLTEWNLEAEWYTPLCASWPFCYTDTYVAAMQSIMYSDVLNIRPFNMSMIAFYFQTEGSATTYATYNHMKYFGPGMIIVNSTSSNSTNLKIVAAYNSTLFVFRIVNVFQVVTSNIVVSVSLPSTITGSLFSAVNCFNMSEIYYFGGSNQITIAALNQYDIKYFSLVISPTATPFDAAFISYPNKTN